MPINNYIKSISIKFMGFSVTGLITTAISLLLLLFFINVLGTPILYSYIIVYPGTILLSYFLNRKVVFKYNGEKSKLIFYYLIYFTGMALGVLLIKVAKLYTNWDDTIVVLVVLPTTTLFNFVLVSYLFESFKQYEK